ncbi:MULTISPECIES: very short patch repair endonuclease [unclassified Mesorhizobium]|uniref:very short patch repair endonuclease n=1 Tax=unclassified Mesorhizobium TaxID=325217 RepID=UPI0032B02210
MARVRGKDTAPEIAVRKVAHSVGLRFRLHDPKLPGHPDLVFVRHRLVIFVHGCFWHRHPGCKRCTMPTTRSEFWQAKFDGNVARDSRTAQLLRDDGWRVEIIWECETADREFLVARLKVLFS